MTEIHTTPQILEVANFALLRALIITMENKGLLSENEIKMLGATAISMCKTTRNEDAGSGAAAAQLLDHWITSTFG
jgi:hypothetical protein